MIKELKINTQYYTGIMVLPFYSKVMCTKINDDGTYGTLHNPRYSCISIAKAHWTYTKQAAIEDMKIYYLSQFHKKDLKKKAIIYTNFQRDMKKYLKEENPEYFL